MASSLITSSASTAGPNVQIILVFLMFYFLHKSTNDNTITYYKSSAMLTFYYSISRKSGKFSEFAVRQIATLSLASFGFDLTMDNLSFSNGLLTPYRLHRQDS